MNKNDIFEIEQNLSGTMPWDRLCAFCKRRIYGIRNEPLCTCKEGYHRYLQTEGFTEINRQSRIKHNRKLGHAKIKKAQVI